MRSNHFEKYRLHRDNSVHRSSLALCHFHPLLTNFLQIDIEIQTLKWKLWMLFLRNHFFLAVCNIIKKRKKKKREKKTHFPFHFSFIVKITWHSIDSFRILHSSLLLIVSLITPIIHVIHLVRLKLIPGMC